MGTSGRQHEVIHIYICDPPPQNQPYWAGYQSEIQANLVAQGDNYRFSLFGIDRQRNHSSPQKSAS